METNERLRQQAAALHQVLGYQTQVDEDGTLCGVSRQAVDETRAILAELPRLLADSEALAKLRARIEAAPVVQVVETGGRLIATSSPNDHSVTVGQRVALLPVNTTRAQGEGNGDA